MVMRSEQMQKGVGETGCFPVVEILKPQGFKEQILQRSGHKFATFAHFAW